jgi:hypothetical protein
LRKPGQKKIKTINEVILVMPKKLIEMAEKEGIIIRHCILPGDILGVYYAVCCRDPVILLHEDIINCNKLHRCILAEEIGHHFTCGLNLVAFARQQKTYVTEQYERDALWWATKELVPWHELVGAVVDDKLLHSYELSSHFQVTERFLGTSLALYNEKLPRKMNMINKMLQE